MNRIDAHQHFWKYDSVRDAWIDESMGVIQRDFLPGDLEPLLQKNNLDGCLAVQAGQSEAETEFLLALAHRNPLIKGVVGWIDLKDENVGKRLAHFAEDPYLKGVRHIVQAEPDGFMLQTDFQRGIAALGEHGLTYDILIFPHQLEEARKLVASFPEQDFVLDHLAKPNIKEGQFADWEKNINALAAFPNVYCKISGMVTEADWGRWAIADFEPYIATVLNCFGAERCMFGSDWPVSLLSANYDEVVGIVLKHIQELTEAEQAGIMGGNAIKFYKLAH